MQLHLLIKKIRHIPAMCFVIKTSTPEVEIIKKRKKLCICNLERGRGCLKIIEKWSMSKRGDGKVPTYWPAKQKDVMAQESLYEVNFPDTPMWGRQGREYPGI